MRDENLIAASLARPKHLWSYGEPTPTLFDLAAAYGYGLAKNHGFIDGNKRVAFVAMATFIDLNEYSFNAPEEEVVVMMLPLASDKESQETIATWLEKYSVKQERVKINRHFRITRVHLRDLHPREVSDRLMFNSKHQRKSRLS
ncbi:MAG: type II toxin-antitoxin system death-on-curing family toxin [Stigonema ocellatum SAG 48.90 = DSM 106950]|nr:type II toxin-antitoxin system death-on-curing family toxin [Stigonema ocellatum SAG 48.90 = DSM 106950]